MKLQLSLYNSALIVGLIFNACLLFFTLENTYDANIHTFFASHYQNSWFDPWEPRWYTGFNVMTYPPLIHQLIALIGTWFGLKFGLFVVTYIILILFISGVYRYSKLITGHEMSASIAAFYAIFSSFLMETLHIFGQLPTLMGISLLLHSLPSIYLYIRDNSKLEFVKGLSLLAMTVCSHHVTSIFGLVFFVMPLIGIAVLDYAVMKYHANTLWSTYSTPKSITIREFVLSIWTLNSRIILFLVSTVVVMIFFLLPYWIVSKTDPISQIPIPHGSRDNFFLESSSGLIFFLVPWGIVLMILPYLFYRMFDRRNIFFGLSFSLLVLLGTGGTTPIPRLLLGENAFNILTLDRFTFWACIMSLPFVGEFIYRLWIGDIGDMLIEKWGDLIASILKFLFIFFIICWTVAVISLGYFKPFQPQKIKVEPIINFLQQDQHYKWRYLTLGFGDQVSWLSALSEAQMIDGNYHSARRLPELTTRAVERLEGAKFRGLEGIGSLQQILTNAEKYHVKFIFSNDKFYDPLLYFFGWERLTQLENGIWIWQNIGVHPMPKILQRPDYPLYQKIMWGTLPMLSIVLVILTQFILPNWNRLRDYGSLYVNQFTREYFYLKTDKFVYGWMIWTILIAGLWGLFIYYDYVVVRLQFSPKETLMSYYNALDYKNFKESYQYIDKKSSPSFDQFMLEISLQDGLLNSYGKLNSIQISNIKQGDHTAEADVITEWISPLKKYSKTYHEKLILENGNWYIVPKVYEKQIQQNVIMSKPTTNFYTHGKRTSGIDEIKYDDKLQQPLLDIRSATLIENNGQFYVIGEITNVDNYPSGVFVKAELYDQYNQKIAEYFASDEMKHFILPKESTCFKIKFEEIAWVDPSEKISKTYDPDAKFAVKFRTKPTKIVLHTASYTTFKDLYIDQNLNEITVDSTSISGTMYNSGTQEVTIPQILVSYYNHQQQLVWIDCYYGDYANKPQKFSSFNIPLKCKEAAQSKVLFDGIEYSFLNGIKDIKIEESKNDEWIELKDNPNIKYIKLTLNNFIGNKN